MKKNYKLTLLTMKVYPLHKIELSKNQKNDIVVKLESKIANEYNKIVKRFLEITDILEKR